MTLPINLYDLVWRNLVLEEVPTRLLNGDAFRTLASCIGKVLVVRLGSTIFLTPSPGTTLA